MNLKQAIAILERNGIQVYPDGTGMYRAWDDILATTARHSEEELVNLAIAFMDDDEDEEA